MLNILLALGALALTAPVAAYQDGVDYTAKFDKLKGSTVPDGYGGLDFTNFKIAQAQPYLNPKSPPNMIASTDLFGMEITFDGGKNTSYYGTLNSLYMCCLSCVGSECLPGFYPTPCEITAVAFVDGFPETYVTKSVFQYNPPPHQGSMPPNPNTTMVKVTPTGNGGSLTGRFIRLFLTEGVIGTTVYFDNINYRFGY